MSLKTKMPQTFVNPVELVYARLIDLMEINYKRTQEAHPEFRDICKNELERMFVFNQELYKSLTFKKFPFELNDYPSINENEKAKSCMLIN